MRKRQVFLFLVALLLGGCGIPSVKKEELYTENQQELIEDFQRNINEGNPDIIIYTYHNAVMKDDDKENETEKLRALYNEAVKSVFIESNENFFGYGDQVDYSALNDDLYNEIIMYRENRLKEITEGMKQAISQEDYYKAKELYSSIIRNESTDVLREYASVREAENNSNSYFGKFVNVSPYYEGEMADEILAYASMKNGTLDDWIETFNRINAGRNGITKIYIKNPTIGMTKEEVEKSSWGKPRNVNRTVTQQSTREQWVYGDGRYLYFTDGILTSYQD